MPGFNWPTDKPRCEDHVEVGMIVGPVQIFRATEHSGNQFYGPPAVAQTIENHLDPIEVEARTKGESRPITDADVKAYRQGLPIEVSLTYEPLD